MTVRDFAESPARPGANSRRWLALAVLCLSLLIVSLDNTVLNVALPSLVRDLHATDTELQWIVDAYAMVFAGLLLVGGSLADRAGRKRMFLTGVAAFAAGSVWAAFSGSVGLLIAARASMGIGGALLMPATLSIITDTFRDPQERQRAIALWAGTSGVGVAIGPIVGGLLLARFWWGSVFLINVPIAAVALIAAIPIVPESRNPAAGRPDLAGAALSIAGLGLVLWSLIEAPSRGWSSPLVIGVGVGGLAILAAFVLWERASSHPMLNLRFFASRRFSVAVASVGLMMFGLFGTLFVLTQFLQFSLGYSPLKAGLLTLPAAGTIAVIAPLSAVVVRFARTKLTVAAGMAITAGGLWQISTASGTSTFTDILPGLILIGFGAGLVQPPATESVMGSLPRGDTGVGAATNGTFLQVGGALGVAVIGSLLSTRYQDRMRASLAPYHLSTQVLHTVLGSIGGALAVASRLPGAAGSALAGLARAAFASGMDLGLATAALVALGGCVIVLVALPARPPATGASAPDLSGELPGASAPDRVRAARPGGADPGEPGGPRSGGPAPGGQIPGDMGPGRAPPG